MPWDGVIGKATTDQNSPLQHICFWNTFRFWNKTVFPGILVVYWLLCCVTPEIKNTYTTTIISYIHKTKDTSTFCALKFSYPLATGCLLWISFRGDVRFPWDFFEGHGWSVSCVWTMVATLFGGLTPMRWFACTGAGGNLTKRQLEGVGLVGNLSWICLQWITPPTKNASRKWWMIECEVFLNKTWHNHPYS